jgi:anti-sigma factor (TIGR02949 family)
MDCKTALGMLEAYLDDELDRADARELEVHLDACVECRPALERLDHLRRALRDPSLRFAAPAQLRERIAASAASAAQATRARPAWWQLAAACVLAFATGIGVMQLWSTRPEAGANDQLVRDLFASHWRALAATSPVDVVSSDRHTVKPWFAGRIPEAPKVQDFADQGFALVGGRIDYAGNARIPVLVYRHGQHVIDVFVLPQPVAPARAQGYGLLPVTLGGRPAAIVSDMDGRESGALEQLLTSQ